jgi:hypothetical protein
MPPADQMQQRPAQFSRIGRFHARKLVAPAGHARHGPAAGRSRAGRGDG